MSNLDFDPIYYDQMFDLPRELGDWWSECQIDISNLNHQLSEWPAIFSHFSALAVETSFISKNAKVSFETIKKERKLQIHDRRKTIGQSVEASLVNAEVDSDAQVVAAKKKYIKAQRDEALAAIAADTMRYKLRAMRTLGANERAEKEGLEPTVFSRGGNTHYQDRNGYQPYGREQSAPKNMQMPVVPKGK